MGFFGPGGGGGAVDSVNTQTGVVILDADDILDGITAKQYTATEQSKLSGIAAGATVNSTDVILLARANHTGTQTAATISDFDTEVSNNTSVASNTAKVSNIQQTITLTGDVTGSGTGSFAATVSADSITNTKLSNMGPNTVKLNNTTITDNPIDLTMGNSTVLGRTSASDLKPMTALEQKTELGAGIANGIATLDAGGKIPATQLPASVIELLGEWNATTNTPTISDGTGNTGDTYDVTTAGTQNLGSGNITFLIGDQARHSGTVWYKLGASGAVSSVYSRTGAVIAQNGDYTGSQITNVPTGTISSTTVQAAINEIESEKEPTFSKNTAFNKNFGSALSTVTQGNDSRLSDSRTCNNSFDNADTSRNNIGLGNSATPNFQGIELSSANALIDFKTSELVDYDCRIIQTLNGLDFIVGGSGTTVIGLSLNSSGNLSLLGTLNGVTNAELSQLETIGATTLSASQWGYLGSLDQDLFTTSNAVFNSVTVNGPIKGFRPISPVTATSKTLGLSDQNTKQVCENASNQTITVPTNATVTMDYGTEIECIKKGAGDVIIQGAAGVTINGVVAGSVTISTQYQGAIMFRDSLDTWIVSGAI